ncbi:MAG: LptF/LptG family permease [Alphaproteobacteria bacterium]
MIDNYILRKSPRLPQAGLLGKYFFITYVRVVAAGTLVLVAILLLGQVIYSLPSLIASGFNPIILMKIIIFYTPHALTIILPFVLSFGIFVAMRRQFENHEILMVRGFGASTRQLLFVIWKLAFGGFLVLLLLKSYLAPWGQAGYRQVKFLARQNIARAIVEEGRFFSPTPGFTIFIGKKTFNGLLEDIFIFDNRQSAKDASQRTSAISAEKGAMTNDNILTLNNGTEFQVGGERVSSLKFDRYSMDISVFQKQNRRRSGIEIGTTEAWQKMRAAKPKTIDFYYYLLLLNEKIIYSLLGLFLPLFAALLLWRSQIDKSGRYRQAMVWLFLLTLASFVVHLVSYSVNRRSLAQYYIMLLPIGWLLMNFWFLRYWPKKLKRGD